MEKQDEKDVLNSKEKPSGNAAKENIDIGSGLFSTHGIEAGLTFHFASKA